MRTPDLPAPPVPPGAPPREEELAAWRPRAHDARDLSRFKEEQESEEQLFRRVLEQAADARTPLAGLFELTLELCGPCNDDRQTLAERLAEDALTWRAAFDDGGNPLWISLVPREEREETAGALPVLPGGKESASPKGTLRFDEGGDKPNPIPARDNPLFDALDAVVRRITKTPRQEPALAAQPSAGRGTLPAPKSRPLWGLLRMIALGACLAVIYYALTHKGWAPRLF